MVELIPGESYHIDDIQAAFDTSLGWYIKGIVMRYDAIGDPYVLLFSSVLNASGSWIDGGRLFVVGEGKAADQLPSGANRALLDAELDNRPIYGFRKERRGRIWRYLGILVPLGHDMNNISGRMAYVFRYEFDALKHKKGVKIL